MHWILDLEVEVHSIWVFVEKATFKNGRTTFFLKSSGANNNFQLGSEEFFLSCPRVVGHGPWRLSDE